MECFRIDVNENEINRNIKNLRKALSDYQLLVKEPNVSYSYYNKSASWLYEKLLKEALEKAEGIANLIIVADGALGFIPFESLLIEEGNPNEVSYQKLHYLLNDYNLESITCGLEGQFSLNRSATQSSPVRQHF